MEIPARSAPVGSGQADAVPMTFEELVVRSSGRLLQALFLITGNSAEAEEIMQDAFVALWERWDRLATIEDPTGYLFRTAFNLFRKRLRRARVALRKPLAPALARDDFAEVEDREVVFAALRRLRPSERAAIVATSLLGYSSEEAASMLGTTAGTCARSRRGLEAR